MDAALKHIRDGSVRELGCSMLLVEDSLGVFGGRVIFQQVIRWKPQSMLFSCGRAPGKR